MQEAVPASARKGKVRAMRAMECAVGSCGHLHASTTSELTHTVLTHTREVHPEVPMSDLAAEALVERDSYSDLRHSKDEKDRPVYYGIAGSAPGSGGTGFGGGGI